MHYRTSRYRKKILKKERKNKKTNRRPENDLPSRAISHARGHLRVSRFARRTTEKRETARSLSSASKSPWHDYVIHELKMIERYTPALSTFKRPMTQFGETAFSIS